MAWTSISVAFWQQMILHIHLMAIFHLKIFFSASMQLSLPPSLSWTHTIIYEFRILDGT